MTVMLPDEHYAERAEDCRAIAASKPRAVDRLFWRLAGIGVVMPGQVTVMLSPFCTRVYDCHRQLLKLVGSQPRSSHYVPIQPPAGVPGGGRCRSSLRRPVAPHAGQ